MSIALGGFFSGIDTQSIISQLTAVNRIPINTLEVEKVGLDEKSNAFGFVRSSLETLQSKLQALSDPAVFRGKQVTSSEETIGVANVSSTALTGAVDLNITQVATASVLVSGNAGGSFADTRISSIPAGSSNASDVFNTENLAGRFMINGVSIDLDGTEVLDNGTPSSTTSIVGKINNASAGVTASYNDSTGEFSLSSGSTIIMGSPGDTSDFLEQARLFNNGTNAVSSDSGIGRLDLDAAMGSAGLRTTPTTGTFSINGVDISVDSSDTIRDILGKINDSDAGVVANYDRFTDRITLTATSRGALGISVSDGTSNFGSALRLTSSESEFTIGKATIFKVGDDPTERRSEDQNLTADEIGMEGVSFSANKVGTTTLNVTPDKDEVKTLVNEFIEQYNSAQNLVESYIRVDTSGGTESGLLASDGSLTFLPSDLRQIAGSVLNSGGSIQMLEDLGISGNANDNTLSVVDDVKLEEALSDNLEDVIALFTDTENGLANRLDQILEAYTNEVSGVLTSRTNTISDQQQRIDNEIELIEIRVAAETAYLEAQFSALEQAQSQTQSFSAFLQG